MTEPTRLRYYRATDKSMSCAVGTVRALPVVPLPGAYEPLPELDRLVELLPRIERWVAMENAATEPSQPASEILAELEAAPPQPDKPLAVEEKYPLTVEQASGRRVCRICGMSPVEQTLDGEGDVLECAHPDCLDREQAAAAERKVPASETRPVRVFRANSGTLDRRKGDLIALEKIGDFWTFGPRSSWRCSDDAILAKLASGEWSDLTGPTTEPSAESEPRQRPSAEREERYGQSGVICEELPWSELTPAAKEQAVAVVWKAAEELHELRRARDKAQADLRAWREAVRDAIRDFEHGEPPNPVLRQLSDTEKALRAGSPPVAGPDERDATQSLAPDRQAGEPSAGAVTGNVMAGTSGGLGEAPPIPHDATESRRPDETPPQNTIAIADQLLEAFESYESEGGWTPVSDPEVYRRAIVKIVGKALAERDAALANMRAVRDELLAENHAMREAIGKLPEGKWEYGEVGGASFLDACHAAAHAASPRAKEIAEELNRLRGEVHDCPKCGLACKQCLCVETEIKDLQDRLAKAEAAARAGQVLRAATHRLIGDGLRSCVVRTEHVVEYDETIRSLAAEPRPEESEAGR